MAWLWKNMIYCKYKMHNVVFYCEGRVTAVLDDENVPPTSSQSSTVSNVRHLQNNMNREILFCILHLIWEIPESVFGTLSISSDFFSLILT